MKLFNAPVVVIEGNLATLLSSYVKEVRQSVIGNDFNDNFSDDTILYSLLEYSRFDRTVQPMSESRIEYIVRKCVEFQSVIDTLTLLRKDNYTLLYNEDYNCWEFKWK